MSSNNKTAILCMLASALLFSMMPVAFIIGEAHKTPFLFVGILYVLSFVGNIIYLTFVYPDKINQRTLKTIFLNIRHPAIYWMAFTTSGYLLFTFSLKYIDESVAAVLVQTAAIFTVILLVRIFEKEKRYAKITIQKWLLLIMAFIGVGFLIASQSSDINNAINEIFTYSSITGIVIVIIAAFANSAELPANQLWASQVSISSYSKDDESFYSIIAYAIGKIISAPLFLLIGIMAGERIVYPNTAGYFLLITTGLFGLGIGSVFLRISNSKTSNLGINALRYFIPVLSLLWLAMANKINVPRIDWLIIGTTIIILSNLLINIKEFTNKND